MMFETVGVEWKSNETLPLLLQHEEKYSCLVTVKKGLLCSQPRTVHSPLHSSAQRAKELEQVVLEEKEEMNGAIKNLIELKVSSKN